MISTSQLKENITDLEIELKTAIEHGDLIESQLLESNKILHQEISEHTKTKERLFEIIELLKNQKDDLEIIVDSIVKHGDDMDLQWIDKLSKAESLSLVDSLTNIANRRKFDQYFSQEWNRSLRNQNHLSLIMIDIDYFKNYNDKYGHVEGDVALVKITEVINQMILRPADILCRIGGEEFMVVLPETELVGAIKVAKRIHAAVENAKIPHEVSQVSDYVTVSVGVDSLIPSEAHRPLLFIEHLDTLLYKAKEQGRNCVITSEQVTDLKENQTITYFEYINFNQNFHKEYINLSFIPSSISIKQRWRNNGLSADFLSDYVSTFFPVLDGFEESSIKQAQVKNSVAYIANELLENVMKYTASECDLTSDIQLYINQNALVFYVTNYITEDNANKFQSFIKKLEESDPMDMMIKQLEYNAINESSSGLGFLSMINDYSAKLSWQFRRSKMNYIKVISRVEIEI